MKSDHYVNKTNIGPVSEESLAIFHARRAEIIAEATRRALTFQEEVAHHGPEAEQLIATGLDFTTRAIETAMQYSDTSILSHQISWGFDRLPNDGVLPSHVLHRLEILSDVISDLLPAQNARAIVQYLSCMIAEQRKKMADNE